MVIGGSLLGGTTSQCLLYKPYTQVWSSTGALNFPRRNMAAIRMRNGQVLVAGGNTTSGSCLGATEVYDPQLETWSVVGATAVCRIAGRMARLPDDHIMLASGEDTAADAPKYTETFNPDTRLWTRNASMEQPHARGRMVVMQTGNLLIAGGQLNAWFLATVEMFSCQAGRCSWRAAQKLQVARSDFGMLRLDDGSIMVAGGSGGPRCEYATSAYLTGQPCEYAALRSVELFDGVQWMLTGSLNDARSGFLMAYLQGGNVLVTGGRNLTDYVTSSEVYDMRTRVWSRVEPLYLGRGWTSMVTLLNGQVLLPGGYTQKLSGNSQWLTDALLFNPVTSRWMSATPLPLGRSDMANVAI